MNETPQPTVTKSALYRQPDTETPVFVAFESTGRAAYFTLLWDSSTTPVIVIDPEMELEVDDVMALVEQSTKYQTGYSTPEINGKGIEYLMGLCREHGVKVVCKYEKDWR